jgi:hypothetical protein
MAIKNTAKTMAIKNKAKNNMAIKNKAKERKVYLVFGLAV